MRQMELHSPVELQAYADLLLVRNGGDDSACAHSGAQPVASNAHVAALLAAWHGDFGLQGALVFPGVSGALRSSVLDAAFCYILRKVFACSSQILGNWIDAIDSLGDVEIAMMHCSSRLRQERSP